jgi:hypothetical protein
MLKSPYNSAMKAKTPTIFLAVPQKLRKYNNIFKKLTKEIIASSLLALILFLVFSKALRQWRQIQEAMKQ